MTKEEAIDRIAVKLTSTKTWFLIASVLCALASYIGGAADLLPRWLVEAGLMCGFVGGGIYTAVTAYQNAKEAMAKATAEQTINTNTTTKNATATTTDKATALAVIAPTEIKEQ